MKKSIKYSMALCALVPIVAMGADTWWNGNTVGDWEIASNWNLGVPTAADRALINQPGDVVTINNLGAVAGNVNMNNGGKLIIASGSSLAIAEGHAGTGAGHDQIQIDGTLSHAGGGWFLLGDNGSGASAMVTMTINPSGSVTSTGGEFLISGGGGNLIVAGGTFDRTGWLHLGADGGNGSITVTNGGQFSAAVVSTAPNGTAVITIDGGVSSIDTLGWGNGGTGSQTLNINGGQLTLSTLIEGVGNSFNINGGELIFAGTDLATVAAMVSGANWNFPDPKSVVDLGGGTIRVTSIPAPTIPTPTIIGWSAVSNNTMELRAHLPGALENYFLVGRNELTAGRWERVAHSKDGAYPFLIADLDYSSLDASGTNQVIYLRNDAPQNFFGLVRESRVFLRNKTLFQTNAGYDGRIGFGTDGVIIHRHGLAFSSEIASWEGQAESVGRMFFADSDAGNVYETGGWDGTNHSADVEMDSSGNQVLVGTRPYMVPTAAWTSYLQSLTEQSLLAGAAAIFPEEPLAHAYTGYSLSFKQLWAQHYGSAWQGQHTSPKVRFLTAQLKAKLYLDLEESLMETTHSFEGSVVADPAFIIPIHSIYGNIAGQLVAPLGASTALADVDGYIGQIWTGPINWSLGQYSSFEESFFGSAYALYDYFTQLTLGTDKKLWLLVDPVEDDPNHTWSEFLEWYQHSVTAMLLMPEVDSYEVMPWPERIFWAGFATGGGSPAPEDFRKTVLAITQTLQEVPLGGQWSMMGSDEVSPGIAVAIADSSMWQGFHVNKLQGIYGQLLPLIERGIPVSACVLERSADVAYMDRYKVIVVSYEDFKPVVEQMNTDLAAWVQRGGVLVLVGNSNDGLDADASFWWQQLGYASPMHHLIAQVGGTGTGDWSFGSGYVIRRENSPATFANFSTAASVYLPLVDLAIQHTASGGTLKTPGYFMMQRGPFVVAHARTQAISVTGQQYVDIYDPELPVVDGIALALGESGLFREVTQTLAGGGPPLVLHATHRLVSQQFDAGGLRFFVKGPRDTPAVVRVFLGGQSISSITAINSAGQPVVITQVIEGATARLEFPNDPGGVDVILQM